MVWQLHHDSKYVLARPIIVSCPLHVVLEPDRVSEERLAPKTGEEPVRSFGRDPRLLREGNWRALDKWFADRASGSRSRIGRSGQGRGLLAGGDVCGQYVEGGL